MKVRTVFAACMILCGLAVALVVPAVVHADAGLRDGAYASGTSGSPTTSKPESKLWFNDGAWWAVMAKPAGNNVDYDIFKLNLRSQRWQDTGVLVDNRASTRQDVLSVGSTLLIASHKYVSSARTTADPGDTIRLFRYTYNGSTYVQNSNTSIDPPQKVETFVIDRDGSGMVWGTWVQGGQVVSSSLVLSKSSRSFAMQFLGRGDYVSVAAAYRRLVQENKHVVTWDEKIQGYPERAQLLGDVLREIQKVRAVAAIGTRHGSGSL